MKKKISVIVPIYNMEKYLSRALDSIYSQTYHDLEILMVNDGSTDASEKICQEYCQKDSCFVYLKKENGGVSSARNLGLEKATGDYITFVDPDDYIAENMYEKMMTECEKHHADIVMCAYQITNGEQNNDQKHNCHVECFDGQRAQERYFEGMYEATEMTVMWNKIFKAQNIKNVRFPVGRIQEDESVTYKLLYQADKIVYLDVPFYFYYVRQDGYMNQKFNRQRFNLFQAYIERLEFYEEKKEADLWKKLFFLYVHMLCQYKEWMKDADEDCTDLYHQYVRMAKRACRRYKGNVQLSKREQLESCLYAVSEPLYYCMWNFLKRKK